MMYWVLHYDTREDKRSWYNFFSKKNLNKKRKEETG
jgi:hypothetical protein